MGVSPDLLWLLEMAQKNFKKVGETSKTFQTGDLSMQLFTKLIGLHEYLKNKSNMSYCNQLKFRLTLHY